MKKLRVLFIAVMFILIILFFTNLFINPDGAQLDLFFRRTEDYMADFMTNIKIAMQSNFYINSVALPQDCAYPPLVYLIFKFFYVINKGIGYTNANYIFICHYFMFLCSGMLLLCLYNGCKLDTVTKNLMMICFLFSGIFLSSWERGNTIFLAAVCITFFLFNYKSKNKFIKELSLLTLGFGCAIKIAPALLAILLLYEKKWKDIAKVVIYSSILFFIPFLFIEGNFENITSLIYNMQRNTQYYLFERVPSFNVFSNYINLLILSKLIYIKFSFIVSIIALITNFAQKVEWKKTAQLLLVIFSIFSTSFPYVMLYFYTFIVMFFNKEQLEKDDWVYLILFIIILNPLQFVIGGHSINNDLIQVAELILLVCLTKESVLLAIKDIKSKIAKLKEKNVY